MIPTCLKVGSESPNPGHNSDQLSGAAVAFFQPTIRHGDGCMAGNVLHVVEGSNCGGIFIGSSASQEGPFCQRV